MTEQRRVLGVQERCLLCGMGRRSRGYGVCRECFRRAVKETIEGLLERKAKAGRGEYNVGVPVLWKKS